MSSANQHNTSNTPQGQHPTPAAHHRLFILNEVLEVVNDLLDQGRITVSDKVDFEAVINELKARSGGVR